MAVHWSSLRTRLIPHSTSPAYRAKHQTSPRPQPRQETMGNTTKPTTQGTELNYNPVVHCASVFLLRDPSIDSECY